MGGPAWEPPAQYPKTQSKNLFLRRFFGFFGLGLCGLLGGFLGLDRLFGGLSGGRRLGRRRGLGGRRFARLETEALALEALVETRQLPAIQQLLLAAGPSRVGAGIDFEIQRIARFAIGRTGLIAGAVGHDDRDLMVIRMDFVFHRTSPRRRAL